MLHHQVSGSQCSEETYHLILKGSRHTNFEPLKMKARHAVEMSQTIYSEKDIAFALN
jgi:hypothetical protein